ncbi:hypothetical protein [Mycolicibacterium sp.]|uniref:hypothetical protein n=1 Tax=Mycolicibacterium sp. TaxID=2320850 RepID=UPI001A2B6064|nr:hypothetical protein [Mycolicibacterium sp.]MBJ7341024.1 hypothetical protein [Mycolicibacterium sp.]
MKRLLVTAAITGGLAAVGLGVAGVAAADAPAAETIAGLQAEGYSVQMNGGVGQPLSECTVSGVHGASATNAGGTVYVDMACRGGC